MKFKFHLYVQKHKNRTYTITVLPFYDITSYGINLNEIKDELEEVVRERILNTPPSHLHLLEYDSSLYMQKVQIELRPVDPKKRNRRREKVKLLFSLLVHPQEDGQLYVTVPKMGRGGPSFYVFDRSELTEQATIELSSWLDNATLDQLLEYQYSRREMLDTLEVEVSLKKKKKDQDDLPDFTDPFGRGHGTDRFWALKEMGVSLTAQVGSKRHRKAYHREEILEQVLRVLAHQRSNSLILTGPSESGKTAILNELVYRLSNNNCPEALQDREVWMLTPDRIIAGAQFIGTWEERIQDLVNECRKKQHILYVNDLPGLLEIGRWSKSDNNVGQALRPYVASGEVTIIGESTPDRLVMGERMGASFMNLFRYVDIPPMSEEESLSVLGNVARDLEQEYDVRVDPGAVEASTQLSRRFLPYRSFPGKSVRLLEEAVGEVARLKEDNPEDEAPRGSLLRRLSRKHPVTRQHVLDAFSRYSGMPEFILNDRARLDLEDVSKYFMERVRGQDHAVARMVDTIAMVKAGLNDPTKPMATFLFIGPTGVGKTHMAKSLAAYLFGNEDRLIRFDMSEYSDMDGLARLIGAFSSDGELTKQVRSQPFSVVLLDEFEKASPRIYDVFLQVLGEGRLTDSDGRTTYFHNTIIIMTSNLGSGEGSFRGFGFAGDKEASHAEINRALVEHYQDHIERYFRPEFVNRIDQVLVFGQLDPEALRSIAARELKEILMRDGITRRSLLVEIDDGVIDLVLEKGYSPKYGARPLKREIEKIVVQPMARQLAQRAGQDAELLRVEVDRDNHKIVLKNVPIEDANTRVELASGLDNRYYKTMHMDTSELVNGFAMLRRKLVDWAESERIVRMQAEKDALLIDTQRPNFWDDGDDARQKLSRFYFLDRLTRRLRQLQERVEYLEEMAILVHRERDLHYQQDLAEDYQALYRDVLYFEIEMRTGHLPHRHRAMMLINRLGQSPLETVSSDSEWMRQLCRMYLIWAEQKGYDRDVYVLEPHGKSNRLVFSYLNSSSFRDLMQKFEAKTPSEEVALLFEGSNVFGFLKGERGIHKMTADDGRDQLVRNQVFAIPDGTDVEQWLNDYQRIKTEITEGKRPAPPQEKLSVVRTYSLGRSGERFVRDMRTGVRTVRTKDVIEKGQLDEFILSFIQKEESADGVPWEDRFPPTFPF